MNPNYQITPYSFPGCDNSQYKYIITKTAKYYNISVKNLLSHCRKRKYTLPRQMAMVLCFNLIEKTTLERIGKEIGYRNHSTVIHACKTISDLRETNKQIDKQYKELKVILNPQLFLIHSNSSPINVLPQ